jgi:gamma-glutamyltranspeptidase / glutathione hydrolase
VQTPGRAIAGTHCMVSTGHPLATLAALEAFRNGGNAVDAAITAGAVSSVVLPHACGLGGDLFAVGYDARQRQLWAVNGSGKAPALASAAFFSDGIPEDEITAATVPGALQGWAELAQRHGRMRLADLLRPAISWAREGFIVDATLAKLLRDNESKLSKHVESARVFTDNGRRFEAGSRLRQGRLAATLERITLQGPEDFYSGDIARRICEYAASSGGLLRTQDFHTHSTLWEQPIGLGYHGYDVYVSPPNSIGILLLVQLALLQPEMLKDMRHNSGAYIKELLRVKRIACSKVLPLLCDPDSLPVSVADILSNRFLQNLQCDTQTAPVASEVSDTTAIVAADKDGNVVSLIQSVYFHFGCGVVAGDTGILLNNRMMNFSTVPGHPNLVRGGKRPAHTLTPAIVLRQSLPVLAIGTPGAFAQTQSLCQLLNNILVFGLELQQALEAPRWFDELDNTTLLESRIPEEAIRGLISSGYQVAVGGPWEPKTGNAQAVQVQQGPERDVLYGAADLRRNGCVLGW